MRPGAPAQHWKAVSAAVLHRLESTDHGLDTATDQLILLQQRGALRDQGILAFLERPILFLELVADANDLLHARFKLPEFRVEQVFFSLCHARNIVCARNTVNRRPSQVRPQPGPAMILWRVVFYRPT